MTKRIRIVMGSESDMETVRSAIDVLKEFKADFEAVVLSAHRTPAELASYVEQAGKQGALVFIAAAGGAAALAGVIASHTDRPVIGVPVESKSLKGLDSLLSTVQMPGGVPVACMSIGGAGAKNAALFALQVLAVSDKKIREKLCAYRQRMRNKVAKTKLSY